MQAANTVACGDPSGSSSPKPDENSPHETLDLPDSSSPLDVLKVSPNVELEVPEAPKAPEASIPSGEADSELERGLEVCEMNLEQNLELKHETFETMEDETATFETIEPEKDHRDDRRESRDLNEKHERRESRCTSPTLEPVEPLEPGNPEPLPEPSEPVEKPDRPSPARQICVRLRPMLQWERSEGYEPSTMELKENDGTIALKEDGRHRHFRFNTVIGADRNQQEVWEMSRIDAVVNKVALGFHATVFAYGQTGTGKTHTMEGFTYEHHCGSIPTISAARPRVKAKATPVDQLGIVPRAVMALFERVEAMRKSQAEKVEKIEKVEKDIDLGSAPAASPVPTSVVRLSSLQIYNEKIFDLLNPAITVSQREAGGRGDEFAGLRLRWDAAKRHFFVENLFQYECASAEEALQHYQQGIQNKQVASTTMNVASSRSHTLLLLTLTRREDLVNGLGSDEGNDGSTGSTTRRPCREVISQLSLVDLAGSERSGRELREGKSSTRFHEAVNVNQSLFVLRRVITALSKRETNSKSDVVHIPYRESKLTSLLQNSLGGNSYLVMFACVAPSEKQDDENLSTLQYASQAACIRNQPVVNVDPKDQLIQQLEARLAVAHDYLRRALQVSELPDDLLEQENRAADAAAASGGGRRRPRPPHPPRTQPSTLNRKVKSHRNDGSQTSRAKTWTGTEQWGFQEDREAKSSKTQIPEVKSQGSESSRESSKSRAKNLKKTGGSCGYMDRSDRGEIAATATLCRIVQGAAQKSPNSEDWPFATRSKKSETAEGQELFAAVDAMMRGYDGRPKASPRKPKSRPASLPPVVPERSESTPTKPKAGRESPASVQSAETALDSMAGSKCSCCGSDRTPQTDAVDTDKNTEAMEEVLQQLQKARDLQRRLEEELLTAHGKIQDLEVKQAAGQSKLSEDAKVAEVTLQDLRSENAELHKRLEVFYKAMEFDDESQPVEEELTPVAAASPEVGSASIGPKIEKFHSQLVLEAVTLRNEVARLKKKKWIIKAVLDNGGEHERQAIVEEVAQLRSKRDANTSATS